MKYTILFVLVILGTSCSSFNRNPTSENFKKAHYDSKEKKESKAKFEHRDWHDRHSVAAPR